MFLPEIMNETMFSNDADICFVLCVQEVITPIYIMSYYINWVTTSWT